MEKVLAWILFFTSCSCGLAQQNMNGQVFVFHKESNTSYVRLLPEKTGPLNALTVCLQSYTNLKRSYSLFSLNTPSRDNEFLLFPYPTPKKQISVSVGSKDFYFQLTEEDVLEWRSTCVSWESSTGLLALWVNGKPYPQTVFQKGHIIKANPIIIIGQEQDSYGGKFDATQSFIGELSNVHMWDKVLTHQEIKSVINNNDVAGNVINWGSLKYEKVDDVTISSYFCPIYYNPC